MELRTIDDFKAFAGNGLEGRVNGDLISGGNLNFISGRCDIGKDFIAKAESLSSQGKTPIFFASEGKLLGIIAVADKIRKDSSEAISELKARGLITVMLTGDNKRTAESIGKTAGVDLTIAGVLPADKERIVKELKDYGKVLMV